MGTAWQLVEIVSVDDRVVARGDRSLYTLEFKTGGSVKVRTDCNRGTGPWTSACRGQLRSGQIAATQALCPPGSLHARYMAQFPWVRSDIIKDGELFLATMTDGSIVELEPMELPLAATVLGEEVRTTKPDEMQHIGLTALSDHYGHKGQDAHLCDSVHRALGCEPIDFSATAHGPAAWGVWGGGGNGMKSLVPLAAAGSRDLLHPQGNPSMSHRPSLEVTR